MKTTPSETTIFIDKYTELRGADVVRHIYADDKLIASIDELNDVTYNHADHLSHSHWGGSLSFLCRNKLYEAKIQQQE